jgi:hypothetical protein
MDGFSNDLFGRGQALEKLGTPELAREVYSELALREDLKTTKAAADGKARALALGGIIPRSVPEGGEIPPLAGSGKAES